MKMTKYLMLAGVAIALTSCEKNDNTPKDGVAAEISTNLASRVQSRMADSEWDSGDAIGIFTLNDELNGVVVDEVPQSNMGVNLKYTRTAKTWDGGATAFRFKNPVSTDVTFKAYYPYQENEKITEKDAKLIDGTITVDASTQTQEKQKTFDFLYADKTDAEGKNPSTGSKDAPKVSFQFKHSMAKVIIVLVPDTDKGVKFSDVQGMVPTLKGLLAKGSFSLADGKVTASGAVAPLELKNSTEDEAASTKTFIAIVPPQAAPAAAELSIAAGSDGIYRSAQIFDKQALEAGKSYKYTITVKKMELVIEKSEIANWEEGVSDGKGDAILQ